MARGSKSKYTPKQRRQARHIEESESKRGSLEKRAERIAWATVNKVTGGGKKSGSGRGKKEKPSPARKGGHESRRKRVRVGKSRVRAGRKPGRSRRVS